MPKSVELEQRVSRLEMVLQDLRDTLHVLSNRFIALQAQIDHIDARLSGRR